MNAVPYLGESFAIGSALSWAVGVILFRKAGDKVHPLALNFFKNALSFILVIALILIMDPVMLGHLPKGDVFLLLVSGVLGMGISDTFSLAALNLLGAGTTAILWTLYTPMVIALSMLYLGERLTMLQYAGVLAVLVAILMVVYGRNGNGTRESRKTFWVGFLWVVAGLLTQAVSTVAVKPVLEHTPVLIVTEGRLLGGLLFLLPVIMARKDHVSLWKSLSAKENFRIILPASFAGTFMAHTLMMAAVKYTLASTATVLNQTSNLFIFVFAVLFLSEKAGPRKVIGIILGLMGAVFVTLGGS